MHGFPGVFFKDLFFNDVDATAYLCIGRYMPHYLLSCSSFFCFEMIVNWNASYPMNPLIIIFCSTFSNHH